MMHNDLSNMSGVTIGFRCVDFLVKFKKEGLKDNLLNIIVGKEKRADIDESVKNFMEYLFRNTEFNVDLVIEEKEYTEGLKELIDTMPFSRVVIVSKLSQISQRLLTGDLTYYVDSDINRLNQINSKYAVTFEQLQKLIKVRRDR